MSGWTRKRFQTSVTIGGISLSAGPAPGRIRPGSRGGTPTGASWRASLHGQRRVARQLPSHIPNRSACNDRLAAASGSRRLCKNGGRPAPRFSRGCCARGERSERHGRGLAEIGERRGGGPRSRHDHKIAARPHREFTDRGAERLAKPARRALDGRRSSSCASETHARAHVGGSSADRCASRSSPFSRWNKTIKKRRCVHVSIAADAASSPWGIVRGLPKSGGRNLGLSLRCGAGGNRVMVVGSICCTSEEKGSR